MDNQKGTSLSEVLISLALSTVLISLLIQLYITTKQHYLKMEHLLETQFEVQWISDLLRYSIRRAGFTPCLRVDNLRVKDTRTGIEGISGLVTQTNPQSIHVNRMSESFAEINVNPYSTHIIIPSTIEFNEKHPLLIADCDHGGVHTVAKSEKVSQGQFITLKEPLYFSYPTTSYIGEWLEEQWFIKKNKQGNDTLHYHSNQTEELSALVYSLNAVKKKINEQQGIEITLGMKDKQYYFNVRVRGS